MVIWRICSLREACSSVAKDNAIGYLPINRLIDKLGQKNQPVNFFSTPERKNLPAPMEETNPLARLLLLLRIASILINPDLSKTDVPLELSHPVVTTTDLVSV